MKIPAAAVIAASLVLAGCAQQAASPPPDPHAPEQNAAGDIPDNQVFVPYVPADKSFTVEVPEGWARSAEGGAVVFTDEFNSVRVETVTRPQAPTVRSVTTEELPRYQHGVVLVVHGAGGDAVLITYEARSTPDPVTGKTVTESAERYEFWRSGAEVVLTLAGPKGADNVDPWLKVTDSLRWT